MRRIKLGPSPWAEAIATRIADEWDGRNPSPDDADLLRRVLTVCLSARPRQCAKLIGTTIIEESYFEELD
jgi:hypothetical protein